MHPNGLNTSTPFVLPQGHLKYMGEEDVSSLKRGIPVVVLGPNFLMGFYTYGVSP